MRIKYIKLVNFKRFPLRESNVFEHHFNSKLLMISGPNGAGKSSLFNQLTPLPADKSNFYENGYEELHIEKDNDLYILVSDFRGGSRFSFNCNGEELNTAGLVTAQKDLVEKHFNITPNIHDLLIGVESFTSLSLLARKKLFSSITHLNIDKILDGYNQLKEELKTNKLLLKTQATAYQVEEDKLINKDRLDRLKTYLEDAKSRMDTLLGIRSDIARYAPLSASEDTLIKLSELTSRFKSVVSRNYTLITSYPNKDIPRYLDHINQKLSVITYRLQDTYKILETQERNIKQLELIGHTDSAQLAQQRNSLVEQINRVTNSLRFFKDPDSFTEETSLAIYLLESNLPDILVNLQTNIGVDGEKLYTTEKYNRLIDQKRQQVEQLQTLSATEISLKRNLDKVEAMSGDVSCPACSHTWPIKDALHASNHTKEELEKVQQEQYTLRKLMAATERQIEETTEYFTLYKQFTHLRKETEHKLAPFWKVIYDNNLIFADPTGILTYLSVASIDVAAIGEIKLYQEELKQVDKKLDQLTTTASLNLETIKNNIRQYTEIAKELQDEKYYLTKELETINSAKSLYSQFQRLDEVINRTKDMTLDYATDHLSRSLCNTLDDEIRNLKVTTLNLEKELHEANTVQYALDKYKRDIEDTQQNIKVLNLALEELCPKNGLIAKSVSSFLNTIIYNINTTIEKIWDYKMIVRPIDVDNDSLNYKFKVEVEDKLTINDISTCSSGMKEILDLSFRIVLYRLLGLENYPFFFDEFGCKLDSTHKSQIFSLVFSMINSPMYSQLFMITHIDTSIANFRDVEVMEL